MVSASLRGKGLETLEMGEVKGRSLWADARRRFLRNKAAVAGLVLLVLIAVFSFTGE